MPFTTQMNEQAADLYWLAYLLTGDSQPSIDMAVEALEAEGHGERFFSSWMRRWSRNIVIAKALASVREELADSSRGFAASLRENSPLPAPERVSERAITKARLEHALLALDVFPRCVVLLSVFEGAPLADVATLLGSDLELVRKARTVGLLELTRNLAGDSRGASAPTVSFVLNSEMQHA